MPSKKDGIFIFKMGLYLKIRPIAGYKEMLKYAIYILLKIKSMFYVRFLVGK
jgi:hypothetical protein